MIDLIIAALGPVVIGALSVLVYWDARRVGVAWPPVWAVVMFLTGMTGLGLFMFVPSVPIPGLLVILLLGPILYAFERDDTRHSDEPADPHTLAGAGTAGDDRRSDEGDSISNGGDRDGGDRGDDRRSSSDDGSNGASGTGISDEIGQEPVDSDEYAERR
ncbi:hypothetical protein [Halostagnicola kamekurae]|uniref:Uncharacterized protein n=1 Tax=Halostagnicola kamekurae TaxID=619731 RepID=A0A1I6QF57_9EURY|nr:hypothetical protein [Halostagnicola kamekurae]SFS51042.1 hypothetical protein SAMN04488556_1229 [Halostagnicola kamekurae]